MIVLLHEGPSPYKTVEFVPENSDDAECLGTFLKQIEDKIRFKPKEQPTTALDERLKWLNK